MNAEAREHLKIFRDWLRTLTSEQVRDLPHTDEERVELVNRLAKL